MTPPVSDTHPCPAGCGRSVPYEMFACRSDWYRLPKPYRDAIQAGYRSGNILAHAAAMGDARRWYEANTAHVRADAEPMNTRPALSTPDPSRCAECGQTAERCNANACNWRGYCTPGCPDDVCRGIDRCAWPREVAR